jgi:hypothetical protein
VHFSTLAESSCVIPANLRCLDSLWPSRIFIYTASADRVDFTIGDPDENFELSTSPGALDNLIATATEAREVVRVAQEAKK